ncbi:hypothetical protein CASFOL_012112 [Castilleja foliolosa]|uniref:Peptidase A1 domain-containing protein n=1 Tax=Castilleja foliolosa TaxID=1961234 RepID=A0ABD3DPK7_9LAMI
MTRRCFIMSLTFLVLTRLVFSTTISTSNRTKIVLQLVHRDAILQHPIISGFMDHSISNTSSSLDDIRAPLIPNQQATIFLVNISIGEPPIPQLLLMDTASSLTWIHRIHCLGCTPASTDIYDPKSSSTCKTLTCDSPSQCQNYVDETTDCGQDHECKYTVNYVDESSSKGTLALEKFKFVTSTGGEWEIPDLVFGYGHVNGGPSSKMDGLLGLQGFNENSLVSRVGNRFSYCIGNISDPYYAYNRLILGEGAVFEGYWTPLRVWWGHYTVILKGISVGEKELYIGEPDVNVVVDSGSSLTYLDRGMYGQMRQEVGRLLDGHFQRTILPSMPGDLCYLGDLRRDLGGFPMVTLRLAEGAEIYLNVESMFVRVGDDAFCMAVRVSPPNGFNIIGAYAQQYYNIGFDFSAMRASFLSIECRLLED